MKNKIVRKVALGLIATICAVGFAGTLQADPEESQRLRGLGDRVFFVHVVELTGNLGPWEFDNCYFFLADGTWIDPGFLAPDFIIPGTWEQYSTGAATPYFASAEFPDAGFLLEQEGNVTPAQGSGTLQLEAFSTFYIEGFPFLEFLSIGSEVDTCPL